MIDVGSPAIDRGTSWNPGFTIIEGANPANESGTLTRVYTFCYESITGLELATFYKTNGNTFSTRDTETIGNCVAGLVVHTVSLEILAGDYIGAYWSGGDSASSGLDAETTGGIGYWYVEADAIPCTNQAFSWLADRITSLGGGDLGGNELSGLLGIVEERLHYVDAYGTERYFQGTVI